MKRHIRKISLVIIPALIIQLFSLQCLAEVAAPTDVSFKKQDVSNPTMSVIDKIDNFIGMTCLFIGTGFVLDSLLFKPKGAEASAEFIIGAILVEIALLPKIIDNFKTNTHKDEYGNKQ